MSEGVGTPRRLRDGIYCGLDGTYWAWPVDGYWDLHHTEKGVEPDGSDVVEELLPTLEAARVEARSSDKLERWLISMGSGGLR